MHHTRTLLIPILLVVASCQQAPQKSEAQRKAELDSFSRAKYGESSDTHVKRMTDEVIAKAMFDTVGLYKAPVKVLSSKVVREEYSTYRSVRLKFKNISGKTVSAIKFKWYGTNAFNEPADLGNSMVEGFGGGFTDDALRAGKSTSATWSVLSRDAKKIKLAWPTEVSFADGSSWKLER